MEPAASPNFWDYHHHHHHIYFTVTRKVLAHRTGYHKTVKRQKEMLKLKYKKYKKIRKTHEKHNYEKALRETQTLRAGCSKAEPKIFAAPQTTSRGRGTAKIQSAGDGHYLHQQTQFGEE